MTFLKIGTFDTIIIFNTQGTSQIYALPSESALQSVTAIGTGSDSAGVLYGTNATTSMPIKWLGFIEIQEATAGTWASDPLTVQPFMTRRSGDIVRSEYATYASSATNNTNVLADTGLTATITPTSAVNKVLVTVQQNGCSKLSGDTASYNHIELQRAGSSIALIVQDGGYTATSLTNVFGTAGASLIDSPATTSATIYKTQFKNGGFNGAGVVVQDGYLEGVYALQ